MRGPFSSAYTEWRELLQPCCNQNIEVIDELLVAEVNYQTKAG